MHGGDGWVWVRAQSEEKMEQTKEENYEQCWCSDKWTFAWKRNLEKVTKDPDWDVFIKEAAIVWTVWNGISREPNLDDDVSLNI